MDLGSAGISFTRDLKRAGTTPARIRTALARGELIRLRNGLVARPSVPAEIQRAARVGGRLAGVSAAAHHGLWVPEAPLTVAVPEHAGRLWDPDRPGSPLDADRPLDGGVVVLRGGATARRFGVSGLLECLAEVCLTRDPAEAIAVADSALRRSPVRMLDLLELDAHLPPRASGVLTRCDARAETGNESLVRTWLEDLGLSPVPQSRIPFTDFERSDLRIGDRLLIECDSRAHHDGAEQRLRDLRRDARLTALGFIVLRFDHRQITDDREAVLASILRYVDLGLHLF